MLLFNLLAKIALLFEMLFFNLLAKIALLLFYYLVCLIGIHPTSLDNFIVDFFKI